MKKIDFSKIIIKGTEWIANLALLNLSWLLFSLPIFTIIPATDTLFTILDQSAISSKNTGEIFKQFSYYFKKNFKESYKIGFPSFFISIIICIDLMFLITRASSSTIFEIFKYAFYTLSLFLILAILYIYPLSKRFNYSYLQLFFTAIILQFNHPLVTLGVVISLIMLFLIFLYWPAMSLFFAISGVGWLVSTAISFIFKKQ